MLSIDSLHNLSSSSGTHIVPQFDTCQPQSGLNKLIKTIFGYIIRPYTVVV
jgi:hypothetical protein